MYKEINRYRRRRKAKAYSVLESCSQLAGSAGLENSVFFWFSCFLGLQNLTNFFVGGGGDLLTSLPAVRALISSNFSDENHKACLFTCAWFILHLSLRSRERPLLPFNSGKSFRLPYLWRWGLSKYLPYLHCSTVQYSRRGIIEPGSQVITSSLSWWILMKTRVQ